MENQKLAPRGHKKQKRRHNGAKNYNFDEKGVAKVQSSGFAQTDDQKMILLKKIENWRFLTGLERREEFEEGKNMNFEKYSCGLGRGSFF